MKKTSHGEIGALRDESAELLGQQIVFSDLVIPKTDEAKRIVLNTNKNVRFLISQVEVYPWLKPDTTYKNRFDESDRRPGRSFSFQSYGAPLLSKILQDQPNAIAVIKRLLDNSGNERSLADVLSEFDLHPSQFKEFVDKTDNLDLTSDSSPLQIRSVPGLPDIEYSIKENPNTKVSNLDSVLRITNESRKGLAQILHFISQAQH